IPCATDPKTSQFERVREILEDIKYVLDVGLAPLLATLEFLLVAIPTAIVGYLLFLLGTFLLRLTSTALALLGAAHLGTLIVLILIGIIGGLISCYQLLCDPKKLVKDDPKELRKAWLKFWECLATAVLAVPGVRLSLRTLSRIRGRFRSTRP